MVIYTILIGLLIINLLIWQFTVVPINAIFPKLTVEIRENIIPDIQKFLNLLTTLSSASIVLTFSFLQTFSSKAIILHKELLIGSWVLFSLSILMGVIAVNFIFIYRAQQKVMIKNFKDHASLINTNTEVNISSDKTEIIEKSQEVKNSVQTMQATQRRLFLVMYFSSASFSNAIVLLTVFGVSNI